jgi:hypothetical protein
MVVMWGEQATSCLAGEQQDSTKLQNTQTTEELKETNKNKLSLLESSDNSQRTGGSNWPPHPHTHSKQDKCHTNPPPFRKGWQVCSRILLSCQRTGGSQSRILILWAVLCLFSRLIFHFFIKKRDPKNRKPVPLLSKDRPLF